MTWARDKGTIEIPNHATVNQCNTDIYVEIPHTTSEVNWQTIILPMHGTPTGA